MSFSQLVGSLGRNWQKPDFWLRFACTAIVVAFLSQLVLFAHGRDQSIYAAVADGIVHGEMPYRDRWDFKPPGIYLVFTVARALFGNAMWGPRILEALAILALCWSFIRLSVCFFADDRPGYIAAAMATMVHVQFEFWHSGQPETFGGVLTVVGIWLCTLRDVRPPRQASYWFACGIVFGLAFLLKPPLGGGALVCAVHLARNRHAEGGDIKSSLTPMLVVAAGALLPLALIAAWFLFAGAWPALRWTLFEFTPGYTKLGWSENAAGAFYLAVNYAFTRFSALTAVGAIAAAIGAPTSSREREGLTLVLGIIAIHLAGIAMQAKFFAYHFNATLMLVAFLAGLGWFKIWRKAISRGAAGAVAFASLVVVVVLARVAVDDVPHGFWERCRLRFAYMVGLSPYPNRDAMDADLYHVADYSIEGDREVSRRIRELTQPEQSIFVWGFEPLIYVLAERKPASRFLYNVPQRATWERDRARSMLLEELFAHPPQVVVVQHHDYFNFVTGNDDDSARALESFPELATWLSAEYHHLERVEDFDLYLRSGSP